MLEKFVNPSPDDVGENREEFLKFLGGPASIFLAGEDASRTRALVTLLHGNEPSGLMAIHRWIRSGKKPAVNIVCIIPSVEAAQHKPAFSFRVLPGKRDLNRCFKEPFSDAQGKLAQAVLDEIKYHCPESLIDMHNTSGSGPAFGVAIYEDKLHDMLTSLFTQRLIVTHIRLGAIMEISDSLCPTVTIECGGRLDESAHQIAWEGVCKYFMEVDILNCKNIPEALEVLQNPVRLELKKECKITYQEIPSNNHDLTLDPTIERLNTGITKQDTFLAWIQGASLHDIFVSKNSKEQCVIHEMLYVRNQKLLTKKDLKIFMVTTNPEIAKMDCLLYAVKSDGGEIVVSV